MPLDLMPPFIQQVAQFLPFQSFKYVPIQIILGRLPAEVIVRDFALGVVWFGLALALFQGVWRAGLKRFSAVGA